jgi:DNA-binding CsgD family transcriptional regulator
VTDGGGPDRVAGRDREQAALRAALDESCAGRGQVLMVSGEAGMGKTTLAEWLATEANGDGVVVVWGRCPEGQVAPPFTPWLQVLRAWFARAGDVAAAAALGSIATPVLRLLPELSARLDIEAPADADSPWTRFELIQELGETVARAGRDRPLLVIVDDLHAADASSLAVAEAVGGAIVDAPVLLVAAYRDAELTPDAVEATGRLRRLPRARTLALDGLDPEAVRSCIRGVTGREISSDRAIAVWRRTGGNPFFVGEVARGTDGDRLPESIRAVLRRRLTGLDPGLVSLLELAAVFGREFSDRWLATARQTTVELLIDELDGAVDARLVEPSGPGRHRFVHELVREALLDDLPASVLADLHGRAAVTIEALIGPDSEEHVDELALHYADAALVAHPDLLERAVHHLERAAARARRLLAHDEAAAHLDRAVALAATHDTIDAERRADLLLAAGDAWTRLGRYDRAKVRFGEAMDVVRPLGDHRRLATAAIGHMGPPRLERRVDSIRLLEEALAAVPAEDEVLRARLFAAGAHAVPNDRSAEARMQAEEAWQLANAVKDPFAIALAAVTLGLLSLTPDDIDDAVKIVDEGLAAARGLGDLEQVNTCLVLRSFVAANRGEFADVVRVEEEWRASAERTGHPTDVLLGLAQRCRWALLRGDFGTAEEAIEAQQALTEDTPKQELPLWVGQLVFLRWWQGRAAELHGPTAEVATYRNLDLRLFDALIALQAGDSTPARTSLEANRSELTDVSFAWTRPCDLVIAAELALQLDDRSAMAWLHEAMQPWAGLHANWTIGVALGPFDLHLGRLRAVLGDERAIPSLEAALASVAALEARPLMMTTKAALADALERRGGSGDDSRARDLWTDAALLARELQLPDRARDYEAVLVGGVVREPGGLSAREADVLGLLATGASNQQIAEALHVSVKTVERHLSNLYRKLDVTNRTEAAAHALRRLGA